MTSARNQTWRLTSTPAERAQGTQLAQSLGMPELIGRLLAQRQPHLVANGIQAEAAFQFLHPKLAHLPDPKILKGIDTALPRLHQALTNQERIAIFGDYDVDGACASALLLRYFRTLGLTPILYVPNRLTEGYGPNPAAMEKLAAQGVKLIITVDCGSTAHEALQTAQELGIDVIVTDHHQCPPILPPCLALINPNRLDQAEDSLTMLCGAGVAFYLLLALNRYLREHNFFEHHPEPDLRQFLDLVATATIADMVPLIGANRPLLALGFQALNRHQNTGLRALCINTQTADIDATTIGFRLGPRLNAAGRIAESHLGATLLSTEDEAEATHLAARLEKLNTERQAIQEDVLTQALTQAEAQQQEPAIVISGQNWHPGVIGIVAARVKDIFYRPTFVIAEGEDGTATGSGRSISGINLGEAVQQLNTHLLRGGGHAMAAGITLKIENIPTFTTALQAHCRQMIAQQSESLPDLLTPSLRIDDLLTPTAISLDLLENLQTLAPFGPQNREPLFAVTGLLTNVYAVGQEKNHLKIKLLDLNNSSIAGICFGAFETNLGPFLQGHQGKKVTLIGKVRANTYGGITRPDLHIIDASAGKWPQESEVFAA